MTVAVNTLSDRIRRAVRDYPARDALYASMDTPDTAISVSNPTAGYAPGKVIVVDQEAMLVTSLVSGEGAGATFSVVRGWLGTTAATHNATTPVLIDVRFSPADILDAINEGVRQLWPYFFKGVVDETVTVTSELQADYAIPAAFGESGIITALEILGPGLANAGWQPYRWLRHLSGTTRTLSLTRVPAAGTKLRLIGIAPFTGDFAYGGTTSTQMIDSAVTAITMYAKYTLKLIDEAERVNTATAKNIGPAAVAGGQNANLAEMWHKQWQAYCVTHAQRYPKWRTRRSV